MRNFLFLLASCVSFASAQDFTLSRAPKPEHLNLWRVSVATLTAANVLDVQSSWGKHELNSTLSGPAGNFGVQGAAIKSACQGGLLAIEYLVTRHHPNGKLYKAFSIINFGAAGVIGGVAAHNYTVAPPPR